MSQAELSDAGDGDAPGVALRLGPALPLQRDVAAAGTPSKLYCVMQLLFFG